MGVDVDLPVYVIILIIVGALVVLTTFCIVFCKRHNESDFRLCIDTYCCKCCVECFEKSVCCFDPERQYNVSRNPSILDTIEEARTHLYQVPHNGVESADRVSRENGFVVAEQSEDSDEEEICEEEQNVSELEECSNSENVYTNGEGNSEERIIDEDTRQTLSEPLSSCANNVDFDTNAFSDAEHKLLPTYSEATISSMQQNDQSDISSLSSQLRNNDQSQPMSLPYLSPPPLDSDMTTVLLSDTTEKQLFHSEDNIITNPENHSHLEQNTALLVKDLEQLKQNPDIASSQHQLPPSYSQSEFESVDFATKPLPSAPPLDEPVFIASS